MPTSRPVPNLPPLAFGERPELTFTELHQFGDAMQRSGYGLLDLVVPAAAAGFSAKVASLTLPGVTLVAVSSTTHRVATARSARVSLCFGLAGSGTLSIDRKTAVYHRDAAVLMPDCPVQWQIEMHHTTSDFEVSFERERLQATARAMLGLDEQAPLAGLNLDDLRQVSPQVGVVDGRAALVGLAIQAERYRDQPRVLEASGIDDQCARQAVFLLMPEAFQQGRPLPGFVPAERTAVDRLCDWLRANLHLPITLTDMERFTGLAARSLQVSFRKKHGMSPMGWLREQRLLAARDLLGHARDDDPTAAVEAVAGSCGFCSASLLAKWYTPRFGQTPKQALRR